MAENKSIGALWLNESKSGKKYMSGVVEFGDEKVKVVVFKNDYKEEDKHPDYKIFESKPQGESKPAPEPNRFDDDIPPF